MIGIVTLLTPSFNVQFTEDPVVNCNPSDQKVVEEIIDLPVSDNRSAWKSIVF